MLQDHQGGFSLGEPPIPSPKDGKEVKVNPIKGGTPKQSWNGKSTDNHPQQLEGRESKIERGGPPNKNERGEQTDTEPKKSE